MTSLFARTLGAAALIAIAATGAMAQETTNQVAVMSDWSVFTDPASGTPKECWGVTTPKSSEATRDGKPVKATRSEIQLWITFRAGEGGKGEVSYTGGYPFAKDSTVKVDVDGTIYELFTDGEYAWTAGADQDAALIAALKRGTTAVITGASGRGTQTKDTISLRGFTAAMEDAEKRCK